MKNLLYIALIFFTARESVGRELYWNLKRFAPAEKVTKRCDQEPRAWFQKGDVEKACDSLDADLNIIRQAYEVARQAKVVLCDPDVEKINDFFAEAESKMLNQGVITAINTILPNESPEVCEEESKRFISARRDAIDQFFQAGEPDRKARGAMNRKSALLKHERADYIERLARLQAGFVITNTDKELMDALREKSMKEQEIIAIFKEKNETYPELRS
jgi:hypothetical protein